MTPRGCEYCDAGYRRDDKTWTHPMTFASAHGPVELDIECRKLAPGKKTRTGVQPAVSPPVRCRECGWPGTAPSSSGEPMCTVCSAMYKTLCGKPYWVRLQRAANIKKLLMERGGI